MARRPAGLKTRLEPQDEYPHDPGEAKNYNESMYFNVFDPVRKAGGWFRIGNRPNENYAEMSVCLYLPDGRIGFMFGRPPIEGNKAMDAGGLRVEVVEPFKRLKVSYSGKALLLERPLEMAEPRAAFKENPQVPCTVELEYEGVSPMYGGETVREDGSALEIDPERSFARAHYEQHCAAKGEISIGDERFEIDGFGLRDKSWGPRHWQAIDWYRWCPMNFGRDFGMMLSVIGDGKGGARQGGMVFRDGTYDLIEACVIDSDWDERDYQTALRAKVRTEAGKTYEVSGKVMSLIPLRNRRKTPDGQELQTRITEGMTEYRCGGLVGYGLSEYLDQIVDGKPNGRMAGY
ncbi:hypothetical protein [Phenylobacterium sp.]|uniref:DUF7064 domain-containing protein n=1 Tax=Phenylobacterium sp. TaxID=1871053 RepID=UPI00262F255A|nr:hypothetical protein [Phenylobacterium sp.]